MMKKTLVSVLAFGMILSLAACHVRQREGTKKIEDEAGTAARPVFADGKDGKYQLASVKVTETDGAKEASVEVLVELKHSDGKATHTHKFVNKPKVKDGSEFESGVEMPLSIERASGKYEKHLVINYKISKGEPLLAAAEVTKAGSLKEKEHPMAADVKDKDVADGRKLTSTLSQKSDKEIQIILKYSKEKWSQEITAVYTAQ